MTFTIAQITDLHITEPAKTISGTNLTTDDTLARVLAHPLLEEMDAVICSGDLSDDGSVESYNKLFRMLDTLPCPVFCLAGNHDDVAVAAKAARPRDIRWARSLLIGRWQIIMLNSSVPGKVYGELAASELSHMEELLQSHADRHSLICVHHQPVEVGSRWMDNIMLKNGDALLAQLKSKTQAKAVLFGHIHQEFDSTRDALRLLGSPSTCRQFTAGEDDFSVDDKPPAFRVLELKDSGEIETYVVYCP